MTQADKARRDAKRQRRHTAIAAKQEERQRRDAARRQRTLLTYGGVGAGVVLVVVLVVGLGIRGRSAPAGLPGVEQFADQGGTHLQLGQPHPAYNSNPPTSGWHTPQTAGWGAHRSMVPDEVVVHNLEHGGIWISYRDANDTTLLAKLEALVARYRSKVILTPRAQNDAPIAVAAWGRLMRLDAYDEDRIVRFIDAYRNKGPEQVPD
jgi:hypothetical protein